jgi:hypothetical protein
MPEVRWMTLVIVGTLLSAASLADDASLPGADGDSAPVETLSLDATYLEAAYSSRWRLSHPVETTVYSFDGAQPMANLDFQDSGTFSRVKKIRALSLLTLAEGKGTRVFFGVDKEGLVGIHFRGLLRGDDDRFMEIVRMPYLEEPDPDGEQDNSVH